jgi:hypothetical protein
MLRLLVRALVPAAFGLAGLCLIPPAGAEQDLAKAKWVRSTAYVVPKETATEGEGYFSIIEGLNGRLYVGTHANAVNSWLVEFDPAAGTMKVVTDAHKAIGKDLKGYAAQAKIHTRNNVGASGRIYFGTKQGYPDTRKGEKREDYPGGHPMVYDPETGETKVYAIPVPHEGINSITPDESRGVAYISTCSDGRPGPGENAHLLILDLKAGKYRNLIDTKHAYGFIVVDYLGRAYHPMLGGDIARYDPKTDKVERLKQTIDGKAPTKESNLANEKGHPINWDITPDGKTLYALPMSTNNAYVYDLTRTGDTLAGKSLGALVRGPGAPTAGRCASGRRAGCGRRSPSRTRRSGICCTWSATAPATRLRVTTARSPSAIPTSPSSSMRSASGCPSTAGSGSSAT